MNPTSENVCNRQRRAYNGNVYISMPQLGPIMNQSTTTTNTITNTTSTTTNIANNSENVCVRKVGGKRRADDVNVYDSMPQLGPINVKRKRNNVNIYNNMPSLAPITTVPRAIRNPAPQLRIFNYEDIPALAPIASDSISLTKEASQEPLMITDDDEGNDNEMIDLCNSDDDDIMNNINEEVITISSSDDESIISDDDDDDDSIISDSNACIMNNSTLSTITSDGSLAEINAHIFNDAAAITAEEYEFQCIETAFACRVQTCRILPHLDQHDEATFLNQVKGFLYRRIQAEQERHGVVKVNLWLECVFTRLDDDKTCNFKCKNFTVTGGTDLSHEIDNSIAKILLEIDQYLEHSSGWMFFQINHLDLCINVCDPLNAGSFIKLPKWLNDKKCTINIQNIDDDFCFQWSVLCALHPDLPNPYAQIDPYIPFLDDLNFTNINFPVPLTDIPKFESLNSIKINVLSFNSNKKIYPLYYNTKSHHDRVVNLLYIKEEDKSHYCTIINISRLLSSQINMRGHTLFFCMNCLNSFSSLPVLTKHELYCHLHDTARIELPLEKPFCSFKEFNKCYRVPYVCYADFECLLVPTNEKGKLQKHELSSFAYIIRGDYNEYSKFQTYRGIDAGAKFVETLYNDALALYEANLKNIKDIIMTNADWKIFKKARFCKLCEKVFKPYKQCQQNQAFKNDFKVLNHNYVSGEFRGALCNSCNRLCRQPFFLPVVFHNGSKYDFHLFVKYLFANNTDMSVIATTDETYISITKKVDVGEKRHFSLRFLDSYRFLPYSLETLASSLTEEQAVYTVKEFPENHQLMRRKGCFPYDYISGFEKYDETFLPSKKDFFSRLYNSPISDADYDHAKEVWKVFNCSTLGEYSDLYLKSDCYLLCDIMETFRSTSHDNYGLDPLHYYTAPSLSWSAMLKFSKVCLQLLTDYEMILFIEQGIRGGVSQVSHRYVEANIPNTDTYDSTTPPSQLLLLDINNLYGKGMCEYLPVDGFTWLTQDQCHNLNVNAIADKSDYGYILEVDLLYPEHLHDMHNDFPLAPQKHTIPANWVSPYISDTFKPSSTAKLLTTLHPKSHYIIHYKTLQLYLSLGMELVCIHRGLMFNQSPWLAPYIEHNTNLRQTTKNNFGREFYKLMVNSMFGKTMENCRLYKRIVFCQSWEKARKLIAKPAFKETKVFSENLIAVHLYKEKIIFDKPIYLGMSILDLSKHCVYDFHYNTMVAKYQNDITLCYTDTDSFFYWLRNHNFYEDLKDQNFKKNFDLSNYPTSNPLAFQSNKMVLGKVKDECAGKLITHFVGLRSKMYSYQLQDGSAIKKIKGITRCTIKNDITFDDFVYCLNNKLSQEKTIKLITSRMHNISTNTTIKKTLCPLDDKKFILSEDGITCLSYGHIKINELRNNF